MHRPLRFRARAALVALISSVPALAHADPSGSGATDTVGSPEAPLYSCQKPKEGGTVSLKPEMELSQLVTWAMGMTCKNYLIDPRVVATNRKITIVAPARMSPDVAYETFLVALSSMGYSLVQQGPVWKIVETQTATKREVLPIYKTGLPGREQLARYLYRPTYAQADQLVQAFTGLKSDGGDVALVGSMLMITDDGAHIGQMLSLAKLIDVPKGADGLYLLPVLHADATKLQDKLNQILGLTNQPAAPVPSKPGAPAVTTQLPVAAPSKILVDERTNTLIIAGSSAAFERVKALVERIDVALDIEGGTAIHVYRLGSSIAEELAKTLDGAIGNRGSQPTPPKPGVPAPPMPAAATDALGTALEGQVRVIADKPTNSLIVMSSGRDYLALKDVIRQLDVPKRQVYIETVILEVQAGNSLDFGTSSHGGMPGMKGLLLGGVQLPQLSSLSLASLGTGGATLPAGLVGALIGKELEGSNSFLGKSIPSYGVLFQALAGNDHAKLVSAPSIIGVDNEESKHKTGINISYQRGSSTFANGGVTTQNNIERKPLNLELTIKPHVFVDDQVLLELKLDSEDLGGTDSNGQPIWTSRAIDTRVVIRDQQTVVIGSLTQERNVTSSSKVPFLGDIPLLGHLFKYTTSQKRKTNLLVMLTPYIVKDQIDLQHILDRKTRETQEFAGSFTLDSAKYVPKIDYRRKRGLVEEINRTVISVDEDIAARNGLKTPARVEPGPVEYGP